MKEETICVKEDCYFGYTEDRVKRDTINWALEDTMADFKKGLVCENHDLITINSDENFTNGKNYETGKGNVYVNRPKRQELYVGYMSRSASKQHIITKQDKIDYPTYKEKNQLDNFDVKFWTSRANSICKYNNKFSWDFDGAYPHKSWTNFEGNINTVCDNCIKVDKGERRINYFA